MFSRKLKITSLLAVLALITVESTTAVNSGDMVSGDKAEALIPKVATEQQLIVGVDYVPNEIIIKFKNRAAQYAEEDIALNMAMEKFNLSASLDRLNQQNRTKSIKPIFPHFKKNQARLQNLKFLDSAQLTIKEQHILKRQNNAPRNAKVPALDRIYILTVDIEPGRSLPEVAAVYNNDPDVEYAELNYIVHTCEVPHVPTQKFPDEMPPPNYINDQWAIQNAGQFGGTPGADIDAPEAWDIITSSSKVVAVIDSGVNYTHQDIINNMWQNTLEVFGAQGIDDDGNGYVDDKYGYDFYSGNGDPDDNYGHGTHCAGIIGAEGNNGTDITGVCWDAKIMALKIGENNGMTIEAALEAIEYAVAQNVDILSMSWGGYIHISSLEEALDYAYSEGLVLVGGAGNNSAPACIYPAYYQNVISVAATDFNDNLASFSNYSSWIDIAAPGQYILSLKPGNDTRYMSGTSMACPHVAGACALLLSYCPTLNQDQIREILMDTADQTGIQSDINPNSGRLNLYEMLTLGSLKLDREYYVTDSDVGIFLYDGNNESSSATVDILWEGGGSVSVTLSSSPADSGCFSGSFNLFDEGILLGEFTVVYADQNNSTGIPIDIMETAYVYDSTPDIFVDDNAAGDPGPGDPTYSDPLEDGTVFHPFDAIQEAIDAAAHGDTIRVANGAYTGIGNRDIDFAGKAITVRSENGAENCIIDCQGSDSDEHRGFYFHQGEDNSSVLSGFTIKNGFVKDDLIDSYGGGIICSDSYPAITDCIIIGNTAEYGGGMYCGFGTVINACTISENEAAYGGGIAFGPKGGGAATDCIISKNTAAYGGGCYCEASFAPVLTSCIISENRVGGDGGGFYFRGANEIQLINCIISGNSAEGDGGGFHAKGGMLPPHPQVGIIMLNCTVCDNKASTGGGFYNYELSPRDMIKLRIYNSIIWKNYPDEIYNEGSVDINLVYCDILGGWSGTDNIDVDPQFVNFWIFRDEASNGSTFDDEIFVSDYSLYETNQIIELRNDGIPRKITNNPSNEGIINFTPSISPVVFAGTLITNWGLQEGGENVIEDYHLQNNSPVRDVGDKDVISVTTDLDGNPRVWDYPIAEIAGPGDRDDPIIDMGPYEYFCWDYPTQCYGDADGNGFVNTYDFYILVVSWSRNYWDDWNDGDGPYDPSADFDRDGDVDTEDFVIFVKYFSTYPEGGRESYAWPPIK